LLNIDVKAIYLTFGGMNLFLERKKIEQSFRDLKDQLGIHKCILL